MSRKKVIIPVLIPNQKIYRYDEIGEYYIYFTPKTILKFKKDNGICEYKNWITRKDRENIPKGSWVFEVDRDLVGYNFSIEYNKDYIFNKKYIDSLIKK